MPDVPDHRASRTTPDRTARRWLALTLVRLAGSTGAVFGLVLAARATTVAPKVLGVAILLSAIYLIAVVPRSLAHRWRSRPD